MKGFKKILSLVLVLALIMVPVLPARAEGESLEGSIVILHTNDVHGAINEYAKVAALKSSYEDRGAEVLLMDAGDFIQGSVYVSESKGKSAVTLMNAIGYDVSAMGNHELDYGFDNLLSISKEFKFELLCATMTYEDGKRPFASNKVIETKAGIKIGVFGINTPESQTKANPTNLKGLKFAEDKEVIEICESQIKELKEEGCDYIICIGHMGIDPASAGHRSTDIIGAVDGIDLFIDGHSHTTLDQEEEVLGEMNLATTTKITSTGTKLANIGVVTITPGKEGVDVNCEMVSTEELPEDAAVAELANKIVGEVDAKYGKVFAKTEVDLDGARENVRTRETNLGDLITDAMRWKLGELEGINGAAIINGGAIRESILAGDISKRDVLDVLPFFNTLAVVEVTGEELLNALEASTSLVPELIGSFPQVSGIEYTVDTRVPYDAGPEYPGSTYKSPASIGRVTISTVAGKAFNVNDTYKIVVNDFMAAGGDTYSEFKDSSKKYDTGVSLDEVVCEFIDKILGGVVSAEMFADTAHRITIIGDETAPETETVPDSGSDSSTDDAGKYTVKKNDNLWKIAVICYNDGGKYLAIYNANKDILKSADLIYPGQVLTIPQIM